MLRAPHPARRRSRDFRFRYGLVREAPLASLSPARRRLLQAAARPGSGRRRVRSRSRAQRDDGGAVKGRSRDASRSARSGGCSRSHREPAYRRRPRLADRRSWPPTTAGCALLGYTREELLRHPGLGASIPAELPAAARALLSGVPGATGRASTIKLTCRTKSGTFLPIEMALFAFGSAATPASSGSCTTAANTGSPSPETSPPRPRSPVAAAGRSQVIPAGSPALRRR